MSAAEISFFDDFNHYPVGDFPKKLGPWTLNRMATAQWSVEIAKDEQNAFGATADNHYVRFASNVETGPTLAAQGIPNLNVATLSFSVIVQSGEWPLRIYFGKGRSSGETLSMLASLSGEETTGPVVHRFDVVVNHSGSPVAYESGGHSVAPRSMDVWRDGVLIGESLKSAGKLPLEEALDTFVFRTSTGGAGKPLEAWIDWVAVFSGPIVGGDISKATPTRSAL